MQKQQNIAFQDALEIVESLSEYQQEELIDIIRNRLLEHMRDLLSESISEAKKDYLNGKVKKGSVDDLMKCLLHSDTNDNEHYHCRGVPLCTPK
ncbi:hypothetical protein [Candidatus Magnetomonas plexicatena]|uniref:hypothetical protein n=1 Tax=Candidatus Magnetomonas plexicatena TaxID=2552947 RepID=UPI004032D7C5